MGLPRDAAVNVCTTKLLQVYGFPCYILNHFGAGDEHMAAVFGHYHEICQTRRINRPTGAWAKHDASLAMRDSGFDGPVLVEVGSNDPYIDLLRPETLAEAAAARRQDMILRMQQGYDHSYFFVTSFMENHIGFQAEALYS